MNLLTRVVENSMRIVMTLWALLALPPVMASPVSVSFAYTFGSGDVFTGSLLGQLHDQGTPSVSDDYVDGISAVEADLNGVDMRGPLVLAAYDGTGRRDDLPARLYLDIGALGSKGFIIANCADFASCVAASASDYNYFLLRLGSPIAQFFDHLTGRPDTLLTGASFAEPIWHVEVTPVSEPQNLELVLLAGVLGLVAGRRRAFKQQVD